MDCGTGNNQIKKVKEIKSTIWKMYAYFLFATNLTLWNFTNTPALPVMNGNFKTRLQCMIWAHWSSTYTLQTSLIKHMRIECMCKTATRNIVFIAWWVWIRCCLVTVTATLVHGCWCCCYYHFSYIRIVNTLNGANIYSFFLVPFEVMLHVCVKQYHAHITHILATSKHRSRHVYETHLF